MKQLTVSLLFLSLMITQIQGKGEKWGNLPFCYDCTQMLSEQDCKLFGGCVWNSQDKYGKCLKETKNGINTYCQTIINPKLNCYLTFGCAYYKDECVPFAGCSAYNMKSRNECQQVSIQCIYDGTSCIQAQKCEDYGGQCLEIDIDGRKCKYDESLKACRNYDCLEADKNSMKTDLQCNAFSEGCVTVGQGCAASPMPTCKEMKEIKHISFYIYGSCTGYLGIDGPCLDWYEKPDNPYSWKGCTSVCTPKLCKPILENSQKSDLGCAETTCRTLGCTVMVGKTNQECMQFFRGCVSNGKNCVQKRFNCSEYRGTIKTCLEYLGADGNCKGINNQDEPCVIKDCVIDSNNSYINDELCQNYINPTCKSTGKGCVTNLESCTTYESNLTDGSDCLSLIGNDGECKAGSNGKCAPRICTEAPQSLINNTDCQDYSSNCATTGLGCVAQTTCLDTPLQITCEGTKEGSRPCNWIETCISNATCSKFTSPVLCNKYKSTSGNQCIWENNSCREVTSSDLIGDQYLTDEACNKAILGYVTNGRGCVNPKNCNSFFGNKETCLKYTAYCTNKESANSSDSCIDRMCSDSGLNFTTDEDCERYSSGCLTNGKGCISNTEPCSSYDSSKGCDKFYGYFDGKVKGAKCYEQHKVCIEGYCELINGQNNSECDSILSGCLYNGENGCLDPSAPCSSYYGTQTTCSNFKGSSGKISCYYDSQSQKCRDRICTDNTSAKTNADCNKFLAGCITNNKGCIDQNFDCNSDNAACNMNPQKCAKISNCRPRVCSDLKQADSNKDCLKYNSKCRLVSLGSKICQDAQISCNSYSFAQSYNENDKQIYCNSITTSQGEFCAYSPENENNCVNRTDCSQWRNFLVGLNCNDYLGANSCYYQQKNGVCFKLVSCETYTIPKSVISKSDKIIWCNNMVDTFDHQCQFNDSLFPSNCLSVQLKCEYVQSPPDVSYCNSLVNGGNCKWFKGKCYTSQLTCMEYIITSIPADEQSNFCASMRQKNQLKCKLDLKKSKLNCIPITCTDIVSPQSQSDCDPLPNYLNCTYYPVTGQCHDIMTCDKYEIPSQLTSNEDKILFCQNMRDSVYRLRNNFCYGIDYCSFDEGTQKCSSPIYECTSYNIPSTVTNQEAFCRANRDSYHSQCYYSTTAKDLSKCSTDYFRHDCSQTQSQIPLQFDWECDIRTLKNKCQVKNGICVVKSYTIAICDQIKAEGSSIYDKKSNCYSKDCYYRSGDFCTKRSGGCLDYDGLDPTIDNTQFCYQFKSVSESWQKYGCSYNLGDTNCSEKLLCEKHPSPQSQNDCDVLTQRIDPYNPGCYYNQNKCVRQVYFCERIKAIGNSNEEKMNFCQQIKVFNLQKCTYSDEQENCSLLQLTCKEYDITGQSDLLTYCQSYKGCTYWVGNPKNCVSIGKCETYISDHYPTLSECSSIKDYEGNSCVNNFQQKNCAKQLKQSECENIMNPTQQSDCGLSILQCQYYDNKCYMGTECLYQKNSTNAMSFCSSLRNSKTGEPCTGLWDGNANCTSRQCSDKNYTTHSSCQQYKQSCKSDGMKCIEGSTTCDNQKGTQQYCEWVLDSDNLNFCTSNLENTKSAVCASKTCYQNVTSTTDLECETYLSGCVTKGTGCIPKTEPCSSYYGGIEQCQNFVGNGLKCWGINISAYLSSCRNRLCSDILTPKSEKDCQSFLEECRYNGDGKCLHSSLSCFYYKGTINTCQNYKGINGTVLCWGNNNNSIESCRDRLCTDFDGKDDESCQGFLPAPDGQPPRCVTNGKYCVSYPRQCSDFEGTDDECHKFTAKDGPCQGDQYSLTPSTCMPRTCIYAPNTLTTDEQCKLYHPLCVTTGRGCTIIGLGCRFLQTNTSCQARPGCLWIEQCQKSATTCEELTNFGSSYCVNSKINGNKCAWGDNTCRNFTCPDYDHKITTHEECYKLNPKCTTNGKGCINIGNCTMYYKESICIAANTTEPQKRCTWDSKKKICRARQCSDLVSDTDEACKNFLASCRTNGSQCIGPQYTCSIFTGRPSFCLQNSSGYPCLYVNDVCQEFAKCEDAQIIPSFSGCQAFSQQCTLGELTCIPVKSCEKYEERQCIVGQDGQKCKWLKEYNMCSVYVQVIEKEQQQQEENDCAPLNKELCSLGSSKMSCFWWEGPEQCVIAQCTDFSGQTNEECSKYKIPKQQCITDGSKCIEKTYCFSYKTKEACQSDIDGKTCYMIDDSCSYKTCRVYDREECQLNPLFEGFICQYNMQYDQCESLSFTKCEDFVYQSVCNVLKECKWQEDKCISQDICLSNPPTNCNYVQDFYGLTTFCVNQGDTCVAGDLSQLNSTLCFTNSAKTFTWNDQAKICQPCYQVGYVYRQDNIRNVVTYVMAKILTLSLLAYALWW